MYLRTPTDVEVHHLETARALEFSNISVVANGPLRAAIRAETKIGESLITITVGVDCIAYGRVNLIAVVDLSRCYRRYVYGRDGVKQWLMGIRQRLSSTILGLCLCSTPRLIGTSGTNS